MRTVLFICAVMTGLAAACSPPASAPASSAQSPDAPVRAIYAAAAQRVVHNQPTNADDISMSDLLRADLAHANAVAEANQEPFIDGDLALNCQDCSDLSPVAITVTSPPANGRAAVEARFTITGSAEVMTWDMVETPQGWRVDNIRSADGYDLRGSIREEIQNAPPSCAQERGAQGAAALVAQCVQVSAATHPPCNAENSCAMIQGEIDRGCERLHGAQRPAFCETH